MLIQTNKGIHTYSSIEKQKVGKQWVLTGITHDKSTINLCEYKDDEEVVDQYLWYIASELNKNEQEDVCDKKVVNLTNIDNTILSDFCLIAYMRSGKQCVAIEPNYVGYDGEGSILNRMIKKVESQGCVITNACTIITCADRLIIREHEKTHIYGVDFIIMRHGYDKRILDYIQGCLKRKIPFRFEYQQRTNKILTTKI